MKTKSFIARRAFIGRLRPFISRAAAFIARRAICLLALLLATAPAFAQTPNLLVCADQGFMITSKADAASISGGVTYTWQVSVNDGSYTVVQGQTAASLPVPSGQSEAGTYAYVRMVASDACSDVPSNTFTVAVRPAFTAGTISSGSATVALSRGSTVTVTNVTPAAGGDGDISYQWVRSGTSAATLTDNASSYSYALSSDEISNSGTYTYMRYAHDGVCNVDWAAAAGSYVLTVIDCPYTGDDLYIDGTHACQQRTAGANNWEAYIQDNRDSEIYRIVLMPEGKWWLAQNVRYAKVGSEIKNPNTCTPEKCGRWYTRVEATASYASGSSGYGNNKQGVCPPGWALPIVANWNTMLNAISGTTATKCSYLRALNSTCSGGAKDYYGFAPEIALHTTGNPTYGVLVSWRANEDYDNDWGICVDCAASCSSCCDQINNGANTGRTSGTAIRCVKH